MAYIVPGAQKGLWRTPLATSKKMQVASWGDTFHRHHGPGTKAPTGLSLTRAPMEHSRLRTPALPSLPAEWQPCATRRASPTQHANASTLPPPHYSTGSGAKDRVSSLSVLSVQGLETKISLSGERHFPTTLWVTIVGDGAVGGRGTWGKGARGHSRGHTSFIPHLLLPAASRQKYANAVFLHFPCVSPPKL